MRPEGPLQRSQEPATGPFLSQMNSVHNFPTYFCKIHSNIIFPSMLMRLCSDVLMPRFLLRMRLGMDMLNVVYF
jgi:hypothetical protein